jgi:hypothetical protein
MIDQEPDGLTARVFAYGSNMCSGRFRAYEVNPRKPGMPAVLRDHRLCFNKLSRKDCSGKANVAPQEGTDVWGVLYEIPEYELPELVRKEVGYTARCTPVQIAPGLTLDAWCCLLPTQCRMSYILTRGACGSWLKARWSIIWEMNTSNAFALFMLLTILTRTATEENVSCSVQKIGN